MKIAVVHLPNIALVIHPDSVVANAIFREEIEDICGDRVPRREEECVHCEPVGRYAHGQSHVHFQIRRLLVDLVGALAHHHDRPPAARRTSDVRLVQIKEQARNVVALAHEMAKVGP